MYSFEDRFNKLITLDSIRICKIFEIFQFTFIFLVLLVITIKLLNKYYFTNFNINSELNIKFNSMFDLISNKIVNDAKSKKIKLFFIVLRDTFLIIILLFYIRKIALLFPSIPSLINPAFKEHTTLDFSVHIALTFIFIEFLPTYKKNVELLGKIFSD